jgi:hypothetical protein
VEAGEPAADHHHPGSIGHVVLRRCRSCGGMPR